VIEGQVNSERLIKMMHVVDNRLVIEEKGIYSVEKFILSRRLMYWQVYFHKTGMMLEKILEKVLWRVKDLLHQNQKVFLDENLAYLFQNKLNMFDDKSLAVFTRLDDADILYHIKKWTQNKDTILSYLSQMLIDRTHLNKIIIQKDAFDTGFINDLRRKTRERFRLSESDTDYLLFTDTISHQAYDRHKHPIKLLKKNGQIVEFSEASDQLNIAALSQPVIKHFLSYPAHL